MLAYQLEHAQSAVDRGEAATQLSSRVTSQDEAVAALAGAGATDAFWGVRQRALAALAPVARNENASRALIDRAERDPDARVRQTAVTGLAHAGPVATDHIQAIAANDPSLYVRGSAVIAYAIHDGAAALPTIRKTIATDSWQDVLRNAAVSALNQINAPEAWDILLPYIRPGTLVNTRTSAIAVLANKAKGREAELARTLEPLLNDPFYQVRLSAANALGRLGQKSSLAALNARAKVEAESRVLGVIQQAIAAINAK
jgi:HEAT repeat protein